MVLNLTSFKIYKLLEVKVVFIIQFLLTIASYQFLKNNLIFMNHGLFFGANILKNFTVSNFKIKVFSG